MQARMAGIMTFPLLVKAKILLLRLHKSCFLRLDTTSTGCTEVRVHVFLPYVPWDIDRRSFRGGVACLAKYQAFGIGLSIVATVGQPESVLTDR